MLKTFVPTVVLPLIMAIAVSASVPHYISYQGRLTDAVGDPVNGSYELTFALYEAEETQVSVWSEVQTVQVVDGLFDVLLGSVQALDADLFKGGMTMWMTVVSGTSTRAPQRMPIVSVPYAYHTERADTATHAKIIADNSVTSNKIQNGSISLVDLGRNGATDGQVIKWIGGAWSVANDSIGPAGGGGGDITSVITDNGLEGGGESGDVTIGIADLGIAGIKIQANAITSTKLAPYAVTSNKIGNSSVQTQHIQMNAVTRSHIATDAVGTSEIETNGVGSDEIAANAVGSSEIAADAVTGAHILNESISAVDLAAPSVSTTRLFDNSVTATKIFDEPGIAKFFNPTFMSIEADAHRMLVSGSITVPFSGYILVRGIAQVWIDNGWFAMAIDTIDNFDPWSYDDNATAGSDYNLVRSTAVTEPAFYVSAAGTYNFYLRGAYNYLWDVSRCHVETCNLTLIYYPTAYGAVVTSVSPARASEFDSSEPVEVERIGADGQTTTSIRHIVDLRDLELRAARARAQAERLERELLEAQQIEQ